MTIRKLAARIRSSFGGAGRQFAAWHESREGDTRPEFAMHNPRGWSDSPVEMAARLSVH